jgi:capsular polysaccharide biosynthesis protein
MYDDDFMSERPGSDDYLYLEDGTADLASGLTTVTFIRATLRRTARVWCVIALVGMLVGLGVAVSFPPSYVATTSVLLTPETSPGEAADEPILNEQAIAQSRAVGDLAMQKLGLHQNINSFLASYTVTVVTDRVLLITVSTHSASEAVSRANAIATEYLRFRASVAQTELSLTDRSLNQQVAQAQQNVNSLNAQANLAAAQPTSPAQQANVKTLRTEATQASLALDELQSANADNAATAQISADQVVQDSQVLNAATLVPHSKLKRAVLYTAMGLLAALVLGMGIIVASALISDRLRRRDDVAQALGAPVKVSAGPVRLSRWRPGRRGLRVARNAGVQRIVTYLDSAVPPSPQGPAGLAVVPVGDVRVPAVCLVSLAISCARRGMEVVVVDLCDGAPAARLLRVRRAGVQTVSTQGTHMTVVVPKRDARIAPGPLQREPGQRESGQRESGQREAGQREAGQREAAGPAVTAFETADLLLTLATLDPTLGAAHLAGWARGAVVMVTAGESSAGQIHAAGEMIKLAEVPLISGVLVGTDKTDESLGMTLTPTADGAPGKGLHPDAQDLFVTADGTPGGRPSDD